MLRNDPPNNHLQELCKSLIFPEPAVSDLVCEVWQHLVASIHTAGTESVCVLPPSLVMLRVCIFHDCIQYFLPQSLYTTLYYNGDTAVNKHQSSRAGLFVPFRYKHGGADFWHPLKGTRTHKGQISK